MSDRATLARISTARQEIKKSRFLAVAGPIGGEADARAFIADHSDPAANHNCWAWRVGQAYRFNDDGEPGGTAGKPILQAIDGQGLDGVAVVVTRWFGGVLLGSGGLIRAYGGTAATCLREAEKIALIETIVVEITCTFGDLALVQVRLGALVGAQIANQIFTDAGATLMVSLPKTHAEKLEQMILDMTSGRAILTWKD